MITDKERTLLIETLGKQYSAKVSQHLQKLKIKNAIGKDYTTDSIRIFVNGMRENEKVEIAIMQLVNKTIKAKKVMQKITPFLWFDNQAEEAVNLYTSIFNNSKTTSLMRMPDGNVLTAGFQLDGQSFAALNGGGGLKPRRGYL